MPNKRKRRPLEDAPWTSVSVELPTKQSSGKESDNHYDNPKLQRVANDDLPVQPGEDIAMFYGLEVLSSDQYELVETSDSIKKLVIKEQPHQQQQQQDGVDEDEAAKEGEECSKKKRKKKKKKDKQAPSAEEDGASSSSSSKSKPQKKQPQHAPPTSDSEEQPPSEEDIQQIQSNWMNSTGGVVLHERLCSHLHQHDYTSPTPIQCATLSASILGQRNLVGAAPTGSGKTLAFLLPILQHILCDDDPTDGVTALIITPTRELAMQIQRECQKLLTKAKDCACLVGGIAVVKQKRLLKAKPNIIVGTPGRLWAMMSDATVDHVNQLDHLKFLVLDEADRMAQDHCFPQLLKILQRIHDANPAEDDIDEDYSDDEDDEDGTAFLPSLPGIRGEAKLEMLSPDILAQISKQRGETSGEIRELDEDQYGEQDEDNDVEYDEMDMLPSANRVKRQTFIYSATLTLPRTATKSKKKQKQNHRSKSKTVEGPIAEILKKVKVFGETKIVDLTTTTDGSSTNTANLRHIASTTRLPPGLRLQHIKCTQRHKDSHLYAYLVTTQEGRAGPCLVFCNSIAGVRRVGATLQKLGVPVRQLHANMQQKARLRAVESLQKSIQNAVVVCTDVAARGLDIPSVSSVVHYDIARSVDTFVHRSGRTARGVGPNAVGSSISLIAPAEDKAHSKILESIGVRFETLRIDGRLLAGAQERANLASKILQFDQDERKKQSNNQWFIKNAQEAGIELDEDMLDTDANDHKTSPAQKVEATRARKRLAVLLGQPIVTQRFKKFLTKETLAKEQAELKQQQQQIEQRSARLSAGSRLRRYR